MRDHQTKEPDLRPGCGHIWTSSITVPIAPNISGMMTKNQSQKSSIKALKRPIDMDFGDCYGQQQKKGR